MFSQTQKRGTSKLREQIQKLDINKKSLSELLNIKLYSK